MDIQSLFEPKSIAVVGASTKIGSVGNDIVKNLVEQKYRGEIYPVNPKTDVLYERRCYPDLSAIEGLVDCAVIAVPAPIVPTVLREAVAKRVKGVIVISAGFHEAGNAELEAEIAEIARAGDIALLGPNCLGVVNPHLSMNASFARTLPKKGNIAFLSQSGALGTAVLDMAATLGAGFSKFVSLGNKAVLDESALLAYLAADRKTSVIAIYAEDLRNPEAIRQVAHTMAKAKRPKPIIVLKSGKTSAGASALSSHTGSLAGNDASYEALFEEAGILRAETAEELFMLARGFSRLPLPRGKNIAIVTNAGGPGVLSADAALQSGIELALLSDSTQTSLRSFLPGAAGVKNPVDILGDAKSDRYARAIDAVLADPSVHMVLTVLTPQSMTDVEAVAEVIAERAKASAIPIVAAFMGGALVARGIKTLSRKKVSVVNFPEDGIRMLSALSAFCDSREALLSGDRKKKKEVSAELLGAIDRARAELIFHAVETSGRKSLSVTETLEVFSAYGFPLPRYGAASTPEEAERIARTINAPCVLKILSEDITHKSDAGGILLNVQPDDVSSSFQTVMDRVRSAVPKAKLDGILLMEMAARGGVELIAGSLRDPNLGQTLMVGSGGIYVEILKDAAFGLVPVSQSRARRMLEKLRIFPLLDGARGGAKYDVSAGVECISRLSQLLIDFPAIRELDINPILIYPVSSGHRLMVVDGRISL
ncbi:MAG: acetate--CoA ligase family protein [Candidatus Moraniibacteriota bacterium]|nr:MAG: acetate--CoA ligase family protein [Candidatus Moranbacteria bacterium]